MRARTKEEWIALYEKTVGMTHEPLPHELLTWDPERGAMSFIDPAFSEPGVFEGRIIVGDGKFWLRLVKRFMAGNGLTKATFFTRRNPEAVARRFGFHVREYVMEAAIDDFKV
jgi:hypothetical protein